MAGNSTKLLGFSELFCEANPFYFPPDEDYGDEYIESDTGSSESVEPKDESKETKRTTAKPSFPHSEPAISEDAKQVAQCFNFDADGASLGIGSPPYEWNPDWKKLRDFLRLEGRLSTNAALELVKRTRNLLQREPNVLNLRPPYTRAYSGPFSSPLLVALVCALLTSFCFGNSRWRCAWSILRPLVHVRQGWRARHDAIPLSWRLCRPRHVRVRYVENFTPKSA